MSSGCHEPEQHLGPMLGFLKYFRRKNWCKNFGGVDSNWSFLGSKNDHNGGV
jgi:hypothetical protein